MRAVGGCEPPGGPLARAAGAAPAVADDGRRPARLRLALLHAALLSHKEAQILEGLAMCGSATGPNTSSKRQRSPDLRLRAHTLIWKLGPCRRD